MRTEVEFEENQPNPSEEYREALWAAAQLRREALAECQPAEPAPVRPHGQSQPLPMAA